MTQKFNYTTFYIRDRQIVDGSNCFFGLMTALSSQKLKDTKYSMWLQKEVNNSIQQDFLNRVPLCCGWFHWFCYFWVMTILSNQKLKNAKYRFWFLVIGYVCIGIFFEQIKLQCYAADLQIPQFRKQTARRSREKIQSWSCFAQLFRSFFFSLRHRQMHGWESINQMWLPIVPSS